MAASFTLNWQALAATGIIVFAVMFLTAVLITRNMRNHHFRIGIFIERGDVPSAPPEWITSHDQLPDKWPTDRQDTVEIPVPPDDPPLPDVGTKKGPQP